MTTGISEAPAKAQIRETADEFETHQLSLEEQIRQRAHEKWLERGGLPGSDVQDWLEAEEEILGDTGN